MTRQEKIAQTMNAAPAIPRLGIPAYDWWSEGLHGIARNGYATVFPQAIGLAASWNTDLLQHVGTVTSTEARAKFNLTGGPGKDHPRYAGLTLWSPNINIFRDPRWGRGMETYGEDPYLTSQLAVSFIRGLQGDTPDHPRTIATPKHFAVHSGPEQGRHSFDVDVSAYDLEATYTPAFRAAIVDGHAGSVMCAYNALHGTPACASDWLLNTRLRNDWGFNGFVVSDCDAIEDMTRFHFFRQDNASASAAALKSGNDLNCGNTYRDLNQAIARGDIDESTLDQALIRLFTARQRLGTLQPREHDPYAAIGIKHIDTPAHRALALQAAAQSLVLLKNSGNTLPLPPETTLAVLGPDADSLTALEANYQGTSSTPVTPLTGLRTRFGTAKVHYAQGASLAPGVPNTIPETALRNHGHPGLKGEYFDTIDFFRPTAPSASRSHHRLQLGPRRPRTRHEPPPLRGALDRRTPPPAPAPTPSPCMSRAASTATAATRYACTSTIAKSSPTTPQRPKRPRPPSRQITHTLKQPFTLPIPAHTTSAWTWNTVAKTKACVWNG